MAPALIYLLRHGEAEDGDGDDAARRLTEKGERQARRAGLAMLELRYDVDACLASPKVRARETARIACEELGVEVEETAALAGGRFDSLDLTAGRGEVLLVGHDPSFTLLLHDLTGAQARMKKGGLAGISKGELVVLLRPSELSAIAGQRVA